MDGWAKGNYGSCFGNVGLTVMVEPRWRVRICSESGLGTVDLDFLRGELVETEVGSVADWHVTEDVRVATV